MHALNRRYAQWGAALLSAALLASLIPIFLVGDCAHPFGDDYAFSQFVHHALADGTSLPAALWYTVIRYYFGWQGTYAATAIMALQPGLISEQAYILTPVVTLLMLLLSTAALTHTLLRRWLGQSRTVWLGVTAGVLLVTIQYQPLLMQAFFWWNGAIFYTFFYGLMLLLICVVIRLRLDPKHPGLLTAAGLALAVLIGGGNYVTGLLSCLLAAGYALICLIWDRKRLWQPALIGLVLLAGFLVNMLAPGNSVRQAESTGMGPLSAVWASVLQAGSDSVQWFHLPTLGLLLFLAPVLWQALERSKFTFPFPAAATVLLFLILACQNSPHFFALSEAGPGRLRNIVYNSYVWLLVLAEGYWLGWLRRIKHGKPISVRLCRTLIALSLVLAAAGILISAPTLASGQCIQALSDGSAQAYDRRLSQWAETLSDPGSGEHIVLTQPEVRPSLLYYFNLTDDPADFANIAANYYKKQSVVALRADSTPPAGG